MVSQHFVICPYVGPPPLPIVLKRPLRHFVGPLVWVFSSFASLRSHLLGRLPAHGSASVMTPFTPARTLPSGRGMSASRSFLLFSLLGCPFFFEVGERFSPKSYFPSPFLALRPIRATPFPLVLIVFCVPGPACHF